MGDILPPPWSVAGGHDPDSLDQQDDRPLLGPGPMPRTGRNGDPLALTQDRRLTPLDVHHHSSFDDVEQLVLILVAMPRVVALNHAQPHHAVIHPAERLVVPGPSVGIDQLLDVEARQRRELDVEEGAPGILRIHESLLLRGPIVSPPACRARFTWGDRNTNRPSGRPARWSPGVNLARNPCQVVTRCEPGSGPKPVCTWRSAGVNLAGAANPPLTTPTVRDIS